MDENNILSNFDKIKKILRILSVYKLNSYIFLIIIIVIILSGCEQKKFNIKDYTDEKNIEEVVNEFMSMKILDNFYLDGNLYDIIEEKDKNKFNIFFNNITNAAFILCKEDQNIYKFYTEIDEYDGEKLIKGRDETTTQFKEKAIHLKNKIEKLEKEEHKKTHVKVPRIVALGLSLGNFALDNLQNKEFVRLFEELILIKKKIILYDFTMAKNVKSIFDEKKKNNK